MWTVDASVFSASSTSSSSIWVGQNMWVFPSEYPSASTYAVDLQNFVQEHVEANQTYTFEMLDEYHVDGFFGRIGRITVSVGSISFNSGGAHASVDIVASMCVNHLAVDGLPAMDNSGEKCERLGSNLVANMIEYAPVEVSATIVDLDAEQAEDGSWTESTTHDY